MTTFALPTAVASTTIKNQLNGRRGSEIRGGFEATLQALPAALVPRLLFLSHFRTAQGAGAWAALVAATAVASLSLLLGGQYGQAVWLAGWCIALFPLMYPSTLDIAYLGGIEIIMCTWSAIKCPSSIRISIIAG